jgi:hypothetical protein
MPEAPRLLNPNFSTAFTALEALSVTMKNIFD